MTGINGIGAHQHKPTFANTCQVWGTKRMWGTVGNAMRRNATPLSEVLVAYVLLEGALWTLGRTQWYWAVTMAAWVAFCTIRSRQTAESAGLVFSRFWSGFWVVPVTVAIALMMVLTASVLGTLHDLHGARTPVWHAVLYGVWALVQQFLTQSFIFTRLERALGSRPAVIVTALLFGIAHVPNPVLMTATLAMGFGFSEFFRRYRNVYPLAIAHALLGLALAVALPESTTQHMRVGIAWWK